MNIVNQIISNQYGSNRHWSRLNIGQQMEKYQSKDISYQNSFDTESNPPLAISLSRDKIVIATEKGSVFIADTRHEKIIDKWQSHSNAVFDVKWRPHHPSQLITVSGDQSFAHWDLDTDAEKRAQSNNPSDHDDWHLYRKDGAHLSSVKTLSFKDANILSTGSRDGNIHIWDLRTPNVTSVISIPDAHLSTHHKESTKRNQGISRSRPTSTVTDVLFQPESYYLYSSGANDARIKLWDIRSIKMEKMAKSKKQIPIPSKEFKYYEDESSSVFHGFSCLSLDSSYRLYACCSDQRIYCYDPSSGKILAAFSGHRSNNWTGITIMNDYLISGSTDSVGRIWSLNNSIFSDDENRRVFKPLMLLPHHLEVGSVEADPLNYDIYTCSDDQIVHKWSLFGDITTTDPDVMRASKYMTQDVEIEMIKSTPRVDSSSTSSSKSNSVLTPINNYFPPLRGSSDIKKAEQTSSSTLTPVMVKSEDGVLMKTPQGTGRKRKGSGLDSTPSSSSAKKQSIRKKISDYYSPVSIKAEKSSE